VIVNRVRGGEREVDTQKEMLWFQFAASLC
jgi:hypothetical protein